MCAAVLMCSHTVRRIHPEYKDWILDSRMVAFGEFPTSSGGVQCGIGKLIQLAFERCIRFYQSRVMRSREHLPIMGIIQGRRAGLSG